MTVQMGCHLAYDLGENMKIWVKIFIVTIFVTLLALLFVGLTIIENTYNDMLESEMKSAIREQEHINSGLGMFLLLQWEEMMTTEAVMSFDYYHDEEGRYDNDVMQSEKESILNYIKSSAIDVDNKKSIIEVHNEDKEEIFTSVYRNWNVDRVEISEAIAGRSNYIVREHNGALYVFVSGRIKTITNQILVSTYIKNISHISNFRKSQYVFFFSISVLFLLMFAVMIYFVTKRITRPIEDLRNATKNISEGRYNERVYISTKDELADLSMSFNIMAEEIESSIMMLESQSDEKQRFIDNITHELRTPLTSIIGYAEFVKLTEVSQDHLDLSLEHIIEEGKRMLELSKEMMKLLKIGKEKLDVSGITPEEFVLSLYRTIIHRLEEHSIGMDINIDKRYMNEVIYFDVNLMKSGILNLLDNAIKASDDGSKIELGFNISNNEKYFYVKDYGMGMPESEISKILEPFYIIDKARNKKLGGVGLGLSIVNKIAKIHNGRLSIVSKEKVGTTIKLIFEEIEYEDV